MHVSWVCSETAEEPLPASYHLEDEEDHLSLEDELGGAGHAPDDDGVMIASLIDGAAEKNMDLELVAALAADAMTPSAQGGKGSFADDSLERSVNDSALAADVDNFMNGSSESFALDAQQESESPAQQEMDNRRETSSADTLPSGAEGKTGEGADGAASGRNWQHECGLRREDTKSSSTPAPATIPSRYFSPPNPHAYPA